MRATVGSPSEVSMDLVSDSKVILSVISEDDMNKFGDLARFLSISVAIIGNDCGADDKDVGSVLTSVLVGVLTARLTRFGKDTSASPCSSATSASSSLLLSTGKNAFWFRHNFFVFSSENISRKCRY